MKIFIVISEGKSAMFDFSVGFTPKEDGLYRMVLIAVSTKEIKSEAGPILFLNFTNTQNRTNQVFLCGQVLEPGSVTFFLFGVLTTTFYKYLQR